MCLQFAMDSAYSHARVKGTHMKTRALILSLCVSVSAVSGVSAQFTGLDSNSIEPPALTSGQSYTSTTRAETDNPFDYAPQPVSGGAPSPSDIAFSEQEPASLAESVLEPQSVVETVMDGAILDGIPHTSMGPVTWNGNPTTPSPIGAALLRDPCGARRLWANYPAERAAACAAMWEHLDGKHKGHCSSCDSCPQSAPVNRYTAKSGCSDCDACDALAVQATTPLQSSSYAQTVGRRQVVVQPLAPPHGPAYIAPQQPASTVIAPPASAGNQQNAAQFTTASAQVYRTR